MKRLLVVLNIIAIWFSVSAQETFSIVAVDTNTMEVGSAGASCIAGSVIISDVHPGVGAIHTQSFYIGANQFYAGTLMSAGHSPQEIMDSVVAHDTQNDPTIRQYGVADFYNGGARSAAFTGSACFTYANHILGPNYAIQGNILLGQEILDSMEARFLREPGLLCHKLMAAMQGANVPGADTRCLNDGTSSISSFLRVAKLGDDPDSLWLDLNVQSMPTGQEPIDSLQVLFDAWKGPDTSSTGSPGEHSTKTVCLAFPNPSNSEVILEYLPGGKKVFASLVIFQMNGKVAIERSLSDQPLRIPGGMLPAGIYIYHFSVDANDSCAGKFVIR